MEPTPKPGRGTRAICLMCQEPIEYHGPYWQHVGEAQPKHPALPICETCVELHGRDTSAPLRCPHCNRIVGCYWHKRGQARSAVREVAKIARSAMHAGSGHCKMQKWYPAMGRSAEWHTTRQGVK